ncbi:hypothetical protein ACROYT_G037195 [Oculina patagonica]
MGTQFHQNSFRQLEVMLPVLVVVAALCVSSLTEADDKSQCDQADWQASLDKAGWSVCPQRNTYLKGLWRNDRKLGDERVGRIEYGRKNVWALCPNGYFLNGLYKTDGKNLYNIEEGQCCRPLNGDGYDGCYDEDVTISFDNKADGKSQCDQADWQASLDRAGWSVCPQKNTYLKGLWRNDRVPGDERVGRIEYGRCCTAWEKAFANQPAVCTKANWWRTLDRKNVWALCPNGYFLNGLYKTDGKNLYNIEEGQCCRPLNGDGYDGCYDEDVTISFDNRGWSDCQRTGYYMTGIYKSVCEKLYCIEKFKCCRMKTSTQGCGTRTVRTRVVGGVNASPHSWPWQISLRVNGRHICGGSLFKPNWVITAAHCVHRNPNPSGYTVVVGAHIRTGTTAVQQSLKVKKIIKHAGFSMSSLRDDIALLELERPATLSDEVNLVCLPQKGTKVAAGTRCYITGWGRTVGGGSAADTLQQAILPVVSHSQCNQRNSRLLPVDERSMVCAGSGTANQAGGCQGDSGGPFVCQEGGKWVLRGAVSWGNSMCRTDYYTVFARISSFIDWISQNMAGCGTRTVRTRVVGGVNASPHSWPWQISLRVNGRHICGGSLLKPNWVITAAHCVDRNPNPSGYTVVVGAHTRTGTTAVQQSLKVKKIIKHAGFSLRNLRNDIALLELERPATLSNKVNLVCLPQKETRAGEELLVADLQPTHCYKRYFQSCHTTSAIKRTPAWYQLIRRAWFVQEMEELAVAKATAVARLCAKKAANGGAGVSWGHSMCRTDYYSVFARISSFIDWISQNIAGGGGGGGGEGGVSPPSCVDMDNRCISWIRYCPYHLSLRINCKKTCNLC